MRSHQDDGKETEWEKCAFGLHQNRGRAKFYPNLENKLAKPVPIKRKKKKKKKGALCGSHLHFPFITSLRTSDKRSCLFRVCQLHLYCESSRIRLAFILRHGSRAAQSCKSRLGTLQQAKILEGRERTEEGLCHPQEALQDFKRALSILCCYWKWKPLLHTVYIFFNHDQALWIEPKPS